MRILSIHFKWGGRESCVTAINSLQTTWILPTNIQIIFWFTVNFSHRLRWSLIVVLIVCRWGHYSDVGHRTFPCKFPHYSYQILTTIFHSVRTEFNTCSLNSMKIASIQENDTGGLLGSLLQINIAKDFKMSLAMVFKLLPNHEAFQWLIND